MRWRPILDRVPPAIVGQPHDVGKILQVGVDPVRVEELPSTLKVMESSVVNSGVPETAEVWHWVRSFEVRRFKDKNVRVKRPRSLHVRRGPASGDKFSVDDLLTAILPSSPMKPEGGSRQEEPPLASAIDEPTGGESRRVEPHPTSAIDEPTLSREETTELLSRPNGQCGREGE